MTFIAGIPRNVSVDSVNAQDATFQNLTVNNSANLTNVTLQSDLNANNFNINNVNTINASSLNVSTSALITGLTLNSDLNANNFNINNANSINTANITVSISATITGLTLGSDMNANNFNINAVNTLNATSVNINNGLIFTDTVNNRVGIGTTTPATPLHVVGDVRVDGNFTVNGNLTYVNTTNLNVTDNVIVLNAGETGAGVTLGVAGIEIERGTLTNAQIIFDEGTDTFIFRLADGTLLPVQASVVNADINATNITTSNLTVNTSATITGLTLNSDLNANNFNINAVNTLNATSVNSSNLTVSTSATLPATTITGSITPDLDNTHAIGSATNRFANVYSVTVTADTVSAANVSTSFINNAYPIPVALNKGFTTSVTVTETVATLKQEITPDNPNGFLTYVEGIHIIANNPAGSGATLTFEIRALLDDNTEATLVTQTVTAGTLFDDWLRWIYDAIPNLRKIKAIRLYANVDVAPAAGSEPTVQLERVTGIQQ